MKPETFTITVSRSELHDIRYALMRTAHRHLMDGLNARDAGEPECIVRGHEFNDKILTALYDKLHALVVTDEMILETSK